MNDRLDRMIDDAFADELLKLEPLPVDTEKLTENVFARLNLERPGSGKKIEKISVKKPEIIELPVVESKKSRLRRIMTAAAMVVVLALGTVAVNSLISRSPDEEYIAGLDGSEESEDEVGGESTEQSDVTSDDSGSSEKPAASGEGHEQSAPDAEQPGDEAFLAGFAAAKEKLTTQVGESRSYNGVTITLDTAAADENIVKLSFTAVYDEAIDFEALFFSDYQNRYYGDPGSPENEPIRYFSPVFWMNIDKAAEAGGGYYPTYNDGYFVDDHTIKFSQKYLLNETYPDEMTISIRAMSVFDINGNDMLGQQEITQSDENPFMYSIKVDKSAGAEYTRSVKPGDFTFKTDGFQTDEEEETLYLRKLSISPLGSILSYHMDYTEFIEDLETGELIEITDENFEDYYGDSENGLERGGMHSEYDGMQAENFYIEDDLGNLLMLYTDPEVGVPMEGDFTKEFMKIRPDAKSVTITPITRSYEMDGDHRMYNGGEKREYSVADIVGKKVETSPLGGYTILSYKAGDGCIEVELEPYGWRESSYTMNDIFFDTEEMEAAGRSKGLIQEEYDWETGIFTYRVEYYIATEEDLQGVDKIYVYYNGGLGLDRERSVTLPLMEIE